jgi:hypothetical protein
MDRWQVFNIPGAYFLFKIIIPSCWTIEKTTRSGISFGSHWQNAECEPRIFWSIGEWENYELCKREVLCGIKIFPESVFTVSFFKMAASVLYWRWMVSASKKNLLFLTKNFIWIQPPSNIILEAHTPSASVIAAHLPEDSACGMSSTYCWSSVKAAAIFE